MMFESQTGRALMPFVLLVMGVIFTHPAGATTQTEQSRQHSAEVLQEFNQDYEIAPERAISTQSKHEILFWMGTALLILLMFALGFGIAMGFFGKNVFVWHVLSASLTGTLAIVHAVTAFVWFYPS